jgi:hypothetical protein
MEALPKLRPGGVKLHPKATLRSLKMGGCGAYRIDWARMGGDLEELELVGPLRFPMEDVLNAPNLRRFSTNGIRRFPPLRFLLQLRRLHHFVYFSTPPGPKFTKEDVAVHDEINGRTPAKTPRRQPLRSS